MPNQDERRAKNMVKEQFKDTLEVLNLPEGDGNLDSFIDMEWEKFLKQGHNPSKPIEIATEFMSYLAERKYVVVPRGRM